MFIHLVAYLAATTGACATSGNIDCIQTSLTTTVLQPLFTILQVCAPIVVALFIIHRAATQHEGGRAMAIMFVEGAVVAGILVGFLAVLKSIMG